MASTQRTSAVRLTEIGGLVTRAGSVARPLALAALVAALMAPVSGTSVVAQQAAPAVAAEPAQKTAKAKKKPATKEAKAKTEKKDPAAAQQQIDAGVASLNAGKAELAVQQFTGALSGGSLPSNLMARAQYQRGLAYRKLGKPAQAISDLTQALWLKNGLNETERADALQNRIAAYRDAGLPDQDDGAGAGTGSKTAPVRTAQAEAAPVSSTSSIGSPKPSAGFAPAPESQPAASGGGIGNFFGGLFGGTSGSAQQQAAPAATPAPAKQEAAVSAWSANTEVKGPAKAPARATAAPAPAVTSEKLPWEQAAEAPAPAAAKGKQLRVASAAGTVAAPVKAASGQYQLQVGQVKSEQDAQALISRLKQQFAADLGGRDGAVTAVKAGGFGTLHRVTFGPFRDPSEWKSLCPKLLGAGQDCQPITQ